MIQTALMLLVSAVSLLTQINNTSNVPIDIRIQAEQIASTSIAFAKQVLESQDTTETEQIKTSVVSVPETVITTLPVQEELKLTIQPIVDLSSTTEKFAGDQYDQRHYHIHFETNLPTTAIWSVREMGYDLTPANYNGGNGGWIWKEATTTFDAYFTNLWSQSASYKLNIDGIDQEFVGQMR